MFIARISKMALVSDETESSAGSGNPMDLTFKNNDEIEDSNAPSVARFRSVSEYYASKSEPHEEGSIPRIESIGSMSALISKRGN